MMQAEWPSLGTGILPYTVGFVHFKVSTLENTLYKKFRREKVIEN